MKTTAIATSLLAIVFGFNAPQNKRGVTRSKTVPAATIARLAPGKTYEVNLTRKGTVYKFKGGTDFSRVSIRTAAGVETFSELLQTSDTGTGGGLVVGAPSDMRNFIPRRAASTTHFDCGAVSCKCEGLRDCFDLILSGSCGGAFWCNQETGRCFCIAKPS